MSLPIFPPKKFFPLTPNQQEERRLALEKYIQSIGQNVAINNSEILNGFLLNAQQETVGDLSETETLDIFLMNGAKISLNVSTGEYSGGILKVYFSNYGNLYIFYIHDIIMKIFPHMIFCSLQKVYKHIKLIEKYHSYFALFVIIQDELSSNIKSECMCL